MNKFSTHLKGATDEIRLTDAEKQVMRTSLHAAFSSQKPVPSPYRRFLLSRPMATYACMGLLLISGGTTYAAQGSLPGDALYPIKIQVNEKVEVAFALSSDAKIRKNAEIAERRIEEIHTLKSAGTLSAEVASEIERNFDAHASEVVRVAKKARHKKGTASLTREVASSFDTLSATLLETGTPERSMGVSMSISMAAKENPEDFANRVRESAQMIRSIGIDEESEVSSTTSEQASSTEERSENNEAEGENLLPR